MSDRGDVSSQLGFLKACAEVWVKDMNLDSQNWLLFPATIKYYNVLLLLQG